MDNVKTWVLWSELTVAQQIAFLSKVLRARGAEKYGRGVGVFRGVISGRAQIELVDATRTLVDNHGRFIPTELGVTSRVVDANRDFYLIQPPAFDYDTLVSRTAAMFGRDIPLTGREVEERYLAVLDRIEGERQIRKLPRGAHFPYVIPQKRIVDIGIAAEEFVNVLGRAYADSFPNRPFTNSLKGDLSGKVRFVEESRQRKLLELMYAGPVVGAAFPTAFQGFSIPAAREAMKRLPNYCRLGGVFDGLAAIIGHTAVFGRDQNTPGIDFAANSCGPVGYSLYFGTDDDEADFAYRFLDISENCSAMLSVLG